TGGPQRIVCSFPIEVKTQLNMGASAQRLRQVGLEVHRPRGWLPRAGTVVVEARPPNLATKVAHPQVRIGQSSPGERVARVKLHCLLVFDEGLGNAFLR